MDNLILTLLSISNVGKKSIHYFIEEMKNMPQNENDIVDILINLKLNHRWIVIPKLEDVKIAREKAESIIVNSQKQNINAIDILSENFPKNLKDIQNAPAMIFYKGNYDSIINKDCVAVIGSRRADEKGLNGAYKLGEILSRQNYNVVSGLALGCDSMAHKGCLHTGGTTVAVMPCSLDNIYPKENYNLAEDILNNNGCLLSEYALGHTIFKNNFIERDRIQSGLSLATIVVQSDVNSGTMHTVEFAIEQNRILACLDRNYSLNRNIIDRNKGIIINESYDISSINRKIEEYKNKSEKNLKEINNSKQIKFIE